MNEVIATILLSVSLFCPTGKKLLYEDAVYEDEIKTVQLYPNTGAPDAMLEPAATALNQNNLVLEFDDLVKAPESYSAKIIHCNRQWEKSNLSNLDFLKDYNEFSINEYEYSVGTQVAYIHYRFQIPAVKIPGNYLLVVYRGDESDIILSKRFVIYQQLVSISLNNELTGLSSLNRDKQQLDFSINYENYELINPTERVKVVIRQNQRWDNAITSLVPSATKEYANTLEYKYYNQQNSFYAGNEFRFFDMRSLRYPGQNVEKTDYSTYPITVHVMTETSRDYQAYAQYNDLNGNYKIENLDTGYGRTQSDYVNTIFTLRSDSKINGEVYVIGEMNFWKKQNPMVYNPTTKSYQQSFILKQGWYDYQYYIKSNTHDGNYMEGDHYETENEYEILVYYQPLNQRGEQLIGYAYFRLNSRE